MFGDIAIEKQIKFTTSKLLFFLRFLDIKKVLVSNKISFGEKNLLVIGYLHNGNKVKPLHRMLPKTSAYVQCYDGKTKWMYFLIEDVDLLDITSQTRNAHKKACY